MSKVWKRGMVGVAAAGVTSMLLVAGCGNAGMPQSGQGASNQGAARTVRPVPGGTVNLDFIQDIRDLDPALAYDTQSNEVVSQLYDQLVTWAPGGAAKVVPMAAERYSVSPDGLTYTFHLRHGMKFWNGDPVTAQSFIDEFQRVLNKNLGSGGAGFYTIIKGAQAYYDGKAKTISGLQAPDPHTLVIHLEKPETFFLEALTLPFISAVDQKFIDKYGNKAFDSTKAMGSGPFMLQSRNPGQSLVLVKNPNYWRKDQFGNRLPYLDKVVITVNKNDQIDTMNFEQGRTAWIGWNFGGDGLPSDTYPSFMANPKYRAMTQSVILNSVQYLGMNTTLGPTKNPLVRKAIEYAINKGDILRLNNGRGQIANQPLPPGVPGYVHKLPADATYTYDIKKAKQLLAQAGYKNGLTIDFYSVDDPDQLKFDQGVQAQLAKVGIKLNIHASSWGSFLDVATRGKAPMDWLGWVQDFPDASDFLNTLFNSNQIPVNNNWNYRNAQVDAWLEKAQHHNNQEERLKLYGNVTDQIMKDAVWVPIWYDKFTAAVQPWVHGFYIPAVGQDPIEWIWIDKSHQ